MTHRTSLKVFMIAILTLGACSFSSSIKSTSVPLPDEVTALNSLSSRGQDVYTLGSKESRTFASVVEECRKEIPGSLRASTRRLLVGLKDIEVVSEERKDIDGKPLLIASSKATLDSLPILLKTYSLIRDRCVIDIVLWTQNEAFTGNEDEVAMNIATWLRGGDEVRN